MKNKVVENVITIDDQKKRTKTVRPSALTINNYRDYAFHLKRNITMADNSNDGYVSANIVFSGNVVNGSNERLTKTYKIGNAFGLEPFVYLGYIEVKDGYAFRKQNQRIRLTKKEMTDNIGEELKKWNKEKTDEANKLRKEKKLKKDLENKNNLKKDAELPFEENKDTDIVNDIPSNPSFGSINNTDNDITIPLRGTVEVTDEIKTNENENIDELNVDELIELSLNLFYQYRANIPFKDFTLKPDLAFLLQKILEFDTSKLLFKK